MISWNERDLSGALVGNCLSKDIPNLPKAGSGIQNGASVFVIDTPDNVNAKSKLYKFDAENNVWLPQ